jgi:hypothetical protein
VSVLLNNGDGTFAAKVGYAVRDYPRSVAVGDLDGDGKPDLATANYWDDSVSVLLNNGDGTFAGKVNYGVGSYPRSVAVGDFSGDGKPDLAVANYGGDDVSVLANNGDGTFAAQANYGVGIEPISVAVSDFDGDGKPDLAVANYVHNDVSVLRNTTVWGTIIVEKQTDPAGGTGFQFTNDIPGGPTTFNLDDGGSQTFDNLVAGIYTVTETDPGVTPGGYGLANLVCVDGDAAGTASTTDVGHRQATVNLEAGETVTCTFTNTQHGTIIIYFPLILKTIEARQSHGSWLL